MEVMSMNISRMMNGARGLGLATIAGFGVAGVGSFFWGGLLVANVKTGRVPWAIPAMAMVLALFWLYAGGRGQPRRTAVARRALLRARAVPARLFVWSFVAGGLSLTALAGIWIVLVRLTGFGGNPTLSGTEGLPTPVLLLFILMGSLVSPVTEEAAFRGYAQVLLERRFSPLVAVTLSSAVFALYHGPTQGFFWSKLLFFFLVGVVFGVTAYLTNSTLPALPVHVAGDLLFFLVIWPQDAARTLVSVHGPDLWFWLDAGQAVLFTALALLAFRQLARARRRSVRLGFNSRSTVTPA
jgi:membrane protease YdiL (CAAX protease family)